MPMATEGLRRCGQAEDWCTRAIGAPPLSLLIRLVKDLSDTFQTRESAADGAGPRQAGTAALSGGPVVQGVHGQHSAGPSAASSSVPEALAGRAADAVRA